MSVFTQVANYIRSSKAELEKVSWPTRQDAIRYTALVVAVTTALALFFAALDFGLQKTVESVLSRKQQTTTQQTPVTPTTENTPVTTSPSALPPTTPNVNVQQVPSSPIQIQDVQTQPATKK